MMRIVLKNTNPFASTESTIMKTSTYATVLATLSLAVLSTTARADSFGGDTKHGSMHTQVRTNTNWINPEFSRYVWLDSSDTVDRIVISLADQRLYAYNGHQLVAWSNVSSGRPGHDTPTGSFTVSEKDVDHHSSLYDDASMPYFMRLTDGGVGLHAGFLPGYAASHGCVRLPFGMAQKLYQHVESGTPVNIVSDPISTVAQISTAAPVHLAQN